MDITYLLHKLNPNPHNALRFARSTDRTANEKGGRFSRFHGKPKKSDSLVSLIREGSTSTDDR